MLSKLLQAMLLCADDSPAFASAVREVASEARFVREVAGEGGLLGAARAFVGGFGGAAPSSLVALGSSAASSVARKLRNVLRPEPPRESPQDDPAGAEDAEPAAGTPEHVLAAALEAYGTWRDDERAEALLAVTGAPQLAPIVAALRAAGAARSASFARLEAALVEPLAALDADIRGLQSALEAFERRRDECHNATRAYLSGGGDRGLAKDELDDARLRLDASRAALSAAAAAVDGRRRHAVVDAAAGGLRALREYHLAAADALAEAEPHIELLDELVGVAKTTAESKLVAAGEQIAAFREQAAERWADTGEDEAADSPTTGPRPNAGRSSDGEIRKKLAASQGGAPALGDEPIIEGWLLEHAHGRAQRRYFLLDSAGALTCSAVEKGDLARIGSALSSLATSFLGRDGEPARGAESSPGHRGWAREHTVDLIVSCVKFGSSGTGLPADLPFSFQIISPSAKFVLQAESASERDRWISALQGTIAELLVANGRRALAPSGISDGSTVMDVLRQGPGNDRCADCGVHNPDWGDLSRAILVCQACAGIHRGIPGSCVRSVLLDVDAWTAPVLTLFKETGNAAATAAWGVIPPDTEQAARKRYVERAYLPAEGKDAAEKPGALAAAAGSGDARATLALLAAGCPVDGKEGDVEAPLHSAARANAPAVVVALLLNGASSTSKDAFGKRPVDVADPGADEHLLALLKVAEAEEAAGAVHAPGDD